jgi:hypothetical protein
MLSSQPTTIEPRLFRTGATRRGDTGITVKPLRVPDQPLEVRSEAGK